MVKYFTYSIVLLLSIITIVGCGGGGSRNRVPAPDLSQNEPADSPNPYHWTPGPGEGVQTFLAVCELLKAPDSREYGYEVVNSLSPNDDYASPPYTGYIQRLPSPDYPEEQISLQIAIFPHDWSANVFPLPDEYGLEWVPDSGKGWAYSATLWKTTPNPFGAPNVRRAGARVVFLNNVIYIHKTAWGMPGTWILSENKLTSLDPDYPGELVLEETS